MAHLSPSDRLAAGLHPPASLVNPFAAVQAAWRFYGNERITLPQLAGPLIQSARVEVPEASSGYLLAALDWCHLHFGGHASKRDRVQLAHRKDLGYGLLTALAIGDRDGAPIAPICMELRAEDGTHSTRYDAVQCTTSSLDSLTPIMAHVESLELGKPCVFIIDREADSVQHYRNWAAAGHRYLVRADDERFVLHMEQECRLSEVADSLHEHASFHRVRSVQFNAHEAEQLVAESTVVLHRPARTHRVDPGTGKARHVNISGTPLTLRLIVSEIRGESDKTLARWLILSNLSESIDAETIALWYYWRWRIETYHKLLKSAGQQIESWQQESASALARRLLVAAMSAVIVWRLARDETHPAVQMRDVLVRLSGRQMKRGPKARGFTEPALLAGLGVLLTMLEALQHYDPSELRRLAEQTIPIVLLPPKPRKANDDDG